jgi:hypothetical protein
MGIPCKQDPSPAEGRAPNGNEVALGPRWPDTVDYFRPLVIDEICGDDGGMLAVALFHQLEKDGRLLRVQVDLPWLVNQQQIQTGHAVEQSARRAIGERGIRFVEEILRADDLAPITIFGSGRETDGGGILGCFLKDHEFRPGYGHPLGLQR